MRIRLTETAIRKHAREAAEGATRIELADATLPGLRLRLSPGGAATWVLGMRDREGRARRFTLGEFPALGIADARERARDARQAIRHDGIDPIAQRRQERAQGAAAARGEGTLRAVLDAYGEDCGRRPAVMGAGEATDRARVPRAVGRADREADGRRAAAGGGSLPVESLGRLCGAHAAAGAEMGGAAGAGAGRRRADPAAR